MQHSFIPGPDTTRALRDAFGRFATGVCVITVESEIGPIGITANSFTSVSLDPPLLLWCPAKRSRRHDAFAHARHFALHVMAEGQDGIIDAFARRGEAFETCDWTLSSRGVPLIAGAAARFECTTTQRVDAGDHSIVLAAVDEAMVNFDLNPRVLLGGRWGGFAAKP